MNGSIPMLFEMQGKLREALKKIVASDFYVSIGDKESTIVVDIARTRKPESGSTIRLGGIASLAKESRQEAGEGSWLRLMRKASWFMTALSGT